jgi:hypothetical protein
MLNASLEKNDLESKKETSCVVRFFAPHRHFVPSLVLFYFRCCRCFCLFHDVPDATVSSIFSFSLAESALCKKETTESTGSDTVESPRDNKRKLTYFSKGSEGTRHQSFSFGCFPLIWLI